jgi:hypothetical protein
VMQQLTCLTRLSVDFLFNPPTLPPTTQQQYCTLPPRLKLLCIHELQLHEVKQWLPALTAVSVWAETHELCSTLSCGRQSLREGCRQQAVPGITAEYGLHTTPTCSHDA